MHATKREAGAGSPLRPRSIRSRLARSSAFGLARDRADLLRGAFGLLRVGAVALALFAALGLRRHVRVRRIGDRRVLLGLASEGAGDEREAQDDVLHGRNSLVQPAERQSMNESKDDRSSASGA